ncbi:UvrD-helicase domain-containing protein [Embleya sp. NPDC005575]|uniref:UvrD-helicase domain-containing protein n=1 Tax=Embleya sp. NPDC005575 TaxID=3156892 RepID=UPI0033BEAA37
MPQLALGKDFLAEYARLEKSAQRGVREAIAKFQSLTLAELLADKGLHLEKLDRARDARIRTIRVGGFRRGVVLAPDRGETFLLLRVLPHDDAIAWAIKQQAGVNRATHALEIQDVVAQQQATPALEQMAAGAGARLFDRTSDADFVRLGLDANVLRIARLLTERGQLHAFEALLPQDQYEVLFYLAEDYSAEDVWRDVVSTRRPAAAAPDALPDPDDLVSAMARAQGRVALVDGPDELLDILARPFDAWRVFLHPSQHRTAYRLSYAGPAQVSGGPGTGKTVVALHRVHHLAQRLGPEERILLTTYTTTLARSLHENLAMLLPPELLDRVDVTTVDAAANRLLRAELGGKPLSMVHDEKERWTAVLDTSGLPWTVPFMMQEYRNVVVAQDIGSLEAYLKASRAGRGTPLGPLQRAKIWRAIEEFVGALRAEGRWTWLQVCDEAALSMRSRVNKPYRHVIVDEAQDLHPAQWRALRAMVAEGPDDMFIAGDPNQRIYDSKVSLGSLGIKVVGRSSRLRVNYRTTAEILGWCTSILTGQPIQNLDGERPESLEDSRSSLHGPTPDLVALDGPEAELAALVQRVRGWLAAGVRCEEIGVAARFGGYGRKVADALSLEGVPAVFLKNHPTAVTEGVRIGTMHAMKGLEFRCMAVADVTAASVPYMRHVTAVEVDRLQHEADMLAERCLLFVACTRAREALHVSWTGKPSLFLQDAGVVG